MLQDYNRIEHFQREKKVPDGQSCLKEYCNHEDKIYQEIWREIYIFSG
jgi:hypothetical protein